MKAGVVDTEGPKGDMVEVGVMLKDSVVMLRFAWEGAG